MAIKNTLFTRYVVSWENLVEFAWNFGVQGKVRDCGEECRPVKDNRYMPKDGHLVAIKF